MNALLHHDKGVSQVVVLPIDAQVRQAVTSAFAVGRGRKMNRIVREERPQLNIRRRRRGVGVAVVKSGRVVSCRVGSWASGGL